MMYTQTGTKISLISYGGGIGLDKKFFFFFTESRKILRTWPKRKHLLASIKYPNCPLEASPVRSILRIVSTNTNRALSKRVSSLETVNLV